jgi:DNA-binding transcriptional ArsR family regulator
MALVEGADRVRLALSPLRRQLLERLRKPASAAQLAAELDLPRQRVGYHLRLLEQAGLIEMVQERQRRGCTERIMRTTAGSFLVDPGVMHDLRQGDRFAAEQLVALAADTVRQVARMRAKADEQGTRLLTFTLEAQVRLGRPADMHAFTDALAQAVAGVVAQFDQPQGREFRLVVGGHPQIGAADDDRV